MGTELGSYTVQSVRGSAIRDLLSVTARPDILSLAGGLPAPELLPVERIATATDRALATRSALQYGPTTGVPGLIDAIRERESARIGRDVGSVVVTHGSQQALALLAQALLDPGDVVVVEDPGYIGALQAFDITRARVIGVPLDDDGMRIDELRTLLTHTKVRLVHTVSNFHNPRGATLSAARRLELASLAEEFGFWIVEDDPYGELRFAGEPLAPVAAYSDRVIRLSSASKIIAPALRVGWMHGDPTVLALVERLKQGADLCGSSLSQLIVADVLTDDTWLAAHIDRIAAVYGERALSLRHGLVAEFGDRIAITEPEGGMFLWAEFTDGTDTAAALPRAVDGGVAYVPGAAFAVEQPLTSAARLCFTTSPPAELRRAATLLAHAL